MKVYFVRVEGMEYVIKSSSARKAVDGILKSSIGTRIAERLLVKNGGLRIQVVSAPLPEKKDEG